MSFENLKEATLRLQAIIDTATDGIITIDSKGIVESVNPSAAQLFGYHPEEIIGNNVSMLMDSTHRNRHNGYISRYLQTKEARIIGIGREVPARKKDGTVFPIRLGVNEVVLENRIIFTGIIHDLTDVKEAEEKIRRLNEELEFKVVERTEELASVVNKLLITNKRLKHEVQERKTAESNLRTKEQEIRTALEKEKELSELKSRFVSMASHEFRTPLSTILSSVSLISRYTESEQQDKRDKHIKRIKSSVRNLTGILNDFLSLSKLEEGKVDNDPAPFQVNELCMEIVDELQGMMKPGQQIQHSSDPANIELIQDQRLLRNILFNLLSNAIKYSEEGKMIECSTIIEKDSFYLKIEDHGMGIPKQDQAHLFTRFFRAANATNIQGTGLGLNIVRRYVDMLGGSISFESELGKGTTFHVKIPISGL
jgi:two-component system sensor kinase FixL